ncbi:MAG: 8-amino-7-oxononanoate synthase [Gammaproteobacteria bacterium]
MYQLQQRLERLQAQGLTRQLQTPQGIDLTSSDYLGFALDPHLRARFLQRLQVEIQAQGAAGSRLLRGNLPLYEQTEQQLADFVGREATLLFSSGYAANVGLFSSLLQKDDAVFSDAFNHASIIDGIRLSPAERNIFPHRDYSHLEMQLQASRASGLKLIVSESLFSMTGTLADLTKLCELAAAYDALLIIDEAHSTGVWGASLVQSLGLKDKVFATVHTAGKALGASGAWVAGPLLLKQYLVNAARSFLFSTAPIPALAILLQEALVYYGEVGEFRAVQVRQRAQQFRQWLNISNASAAESPIVPVMIGENQAALQLSQTLQAQGWDVRAIRPPTVPVGAAQLRLTVKWTNPPEQLQSFAHIFREHYETLQHFCVSD